MTYSSGMLLVVLVAGLGAFVAVGIAGFAAYGVVASFACGMPLKGGLWLAGAAMSFVAARVLFRIAVAFLQQLRSGL